MDQLARATTVEETLETYATIIIMPPRTLTML